MTPKVAFAMIVFNGDAVLRQALAAIRPYGPVLVAEGPVSYFVKKGFLTSTDHTNDILRELVGPAHTLHGQWTEKDEMMNALNPLIPDETTHVWMVDSDEVWRAEDIESVLQCLDDYDSVSFVPDTFFGGFDHILTGFERRFIWYRIQRWYPGATWAHRPPTILAPDGRPWREHRHWSPDIHFAHYSYVFPRSVKAKWEYYRSRNPKGVIPNWFRKVYLAWIRGSAERRQAIEDQYDGVHEWQPEARRDCRTRLYLNVHPPAIMAELPRLKSRFAKELEACP